VDVLHGAVYGGNAMSYGLDLSILAVFCIALFAASLYNIKRKWIF
jgi:ABC-2 type transport system permease protein